MTVFDIPEFVWTALPFSAMVIALIAGVLLINAIWGRRTGWHPICRACKHDLRGVDLTTAHCPECGTDVTKRGAVVVGRRRVRPMLLLVALMMVGLAGAATHYLERTKLSALRYEGAMYAPVELLVEIVLTNSQQTAEYAFAYQALRNLSEASHAPQGTYSTQVRDGILAAIAAKRLAGTAQYNLMQHSMASTAITRMLNEAEIITLGEHARADLIASNGTQRELCDYLFDVVQQLPRFQIPVRALLVSLVNSDDSRSLFFPQLRSRAAVSKQVLIIDVYQRLLHYSLIAGANADIMPSYELLVESAELTSKGDASVHIINQLSDGGVERSPGRAREIRLLADAPAGIYQLRVRGVIVPDHLMPKENVQKGQQKGQIARVTATEAAAIDCTYPFDQTIDIELIASRSVSECVATHDEALATTTMEALRSSTFEQKKGIAFKPNCPTLPPQNTAVALSFTMSVEQDTQKCVFGKCVFGKAGDQQLRAILTNGVLPPLIDHTKPFVIRLVPNANQLYMHGQHTNAMPIAYLAHEFTLQYQDMNATPQVDQRALMNTPTAQARELDDARRAQLIAALGVARATTDRLTATHSPRLDVSFVCDETDRSIANAPTIGLAGRLELRSEGRLISPVFNVLRDDIRALRPLYFDLILDADLTKPFEINYIPITEFDGPRARAPFDFLDARFTIGVPSLDNPASTLRFGDGVDHAAPPSTETAR